MINIYNFLLPYNMIENKIYHVNKYVCIFVSYSGLRIVHDFDGSSRVSLHIINYWLLTTYIFSTHIFVPRAYVFVIS